MKEYTVIVKIRGTKVVKCIDVEAENEETAKILAISYAKTMYKFVATNVSEIQQ